MIKRLGIYVDDRYRVLETDAGREISVDRAFLLFACEVGRRLGGTVLFGRARPSTTPADYVLPADVELVPLPDYENLLDLRGVLGATLGTLRQMWRGLRDVDAVWVFGPHPFAGPLIAFAILRGRPVVLGIRQQTLEYHRSRLPNAHWKPVLAFVWWMEALYRLLARRLPTTAVGPEIAARYGGGGPLLTMTVSLVRAADVVTTPAELDWDGRLTLLVVGRLEPEKNPFLLVEALARLEADSPGRFRVVWVGRGELEAAVRQRADELGIGHGLELRGYVPFGPALMDLYRGAHILVHVSRTEGVPQVLVEALAAGTPIVATDVGGVRAILDDGEAGLLVPPDDLEELVVAIRRLSASAALRRALVAHGLVIASKTTIEAEAERVARFIYDGVERRQAAGAEDVG